MQYNNNPRTPYPQQPGMQDYQQLSAVGNPNLQNFQQPNRQVMPNMPQNDDPDDDKKKGRRGKGQSGAPVSAGRAFVLGLLAAFVVFLLFGGAIIAFNIISSKNDAKTAESYLEQMQKSIDEQSLIVNITPSSEAVGKALASNANIKAYSSSDATGVVTNGSGVVVSDDGNILTNYHVVENAVKVVVTIDGQDYTAEVIGSDVSSDLSLLKIEAKNLSVPEVIESPDAIRVGQWVMTVGNPYGQTDSVTPGYISAFGRNMTYTGGSVDVIYANMIQTNITMNPGNSGGGLYNEKGQLVGISTLVASSSGDASSTTGISYAIPIDYALTIAKDLLNKKPASHASAGMTVSNVPQDQINKYNLPDAKGAYVDSIVSAGAGSKAGLAMGDVIVKFDGATVENGKDFEYKVRASYIDSEHSLLVLRQGKEMEFTITLGSDNS